MKNLKQLVEEFGEPYEPDLTDFAHQIVDEIEKEIKNKEYITITPKAHPCADFWEGYWHCWKDIKSNIKRFKGKV